MLLLWRHQLASDQRRLPRLVAPSSSSLSSSSPRRMTEASSAAVVLYHRRYRRRLPDVVIAGAMKCGTSALLKFLGAHSRVAAVAAELHYFDFGRWAASVDKLLHAIKLHLIAID